MSANMTSEMCCWSVEKVTKELLEMGPSVPEQHYAILSHALAEFIFRRALMTLSSYVDRTPITRFDP